MQGPPQITTRSPGQRRIWLRRAPILALLAAALLGALFFRDALGVEALARHREALLAFRDAHYLASAAAFLAAYVAIVALSLPGGTVATLAGGFLFGLFPGVLLNVTAATLGAVLLFLAARSGLGDRFASRLSQGGGRAAGLIAAIRQNEWSVLLMLRLVPAVPFFLANLIPAFTGTRLPTYAATTFLGIIPAAFVFTSVGAGLGEVFAQGGRPDLALIFSPPILVPLLGLAVLAALPMLLRALRKGP
ncbi:TVP38/TMEM64 family protein [Tabrizicola sp.]|uniref:TVP38/TMEM64 family protein n=1 Tax=Tabrizicola sp. TaxID=2005166 RepID=UPI0035AFAC86